MASPAAVPSRSRDQRKSGSPDTARMTAWATSSMRGSLQIQYSGARPSRSGAACAASRRAHELVSAARGDSAAPGTAVVSAIPDMMHKPFEQIGSARDNRREQRRKVPRWHDSRVRRLPSLTVVMPAHNESENLRWLLPHVSDVLPRVARRSNVVIVDDGSTDGTADTARALAGELGLDLRVVSHPSRQGYGAAVGDGLRAADL